MLPILLIIVSIPVFRILIITSQVKACPIEFYQALTPVGAGRHIEDYLRVFGKPLVHPCAHLESLQETR